jgi:hypothetical protein
MLKLYEQLMRHNLAIELACASAAAYAGYAQEPLWAFLGFAVAFGVTLLRKGPAIYGEMVLGVSPRRMKARMFGLSIGGAASAAIMGGLYWLGSVARFSAVS